MDKDKQRRLILEAQGWSELSRAGRRGDDGPMGALRGISPDGRKNQLAPNPLTNLNAMHEAVMTLDRRSLEYSEYCSRLQQLLAIENSKTSDPGFQAIDARTGQRAEAFLFAKGLWQPEPERRGGDL